MQIRARSNSAQLLAGVSFLALNEWVIVDLLADREGAETLLRLTEEPSVQVQVNADPDGEDWRPGPSIEECRADLGKYDGEDSGDVDPKVIAGIYALADLQVKAIKAGHMKAPDLEEVNYAINSLKAYIADQAANPDDDRALEADVDTQADGTFTVNTQLPTAEPTLERDASEIDPRAKTTQDASDLGKAVEGLTPPPPPVVPNIPPLTPTVAEHEPATPPVQEAAVVAEVETKPVAKATPKPKH